MRRVAHLPLLVALALVACNDRDVQRDILTYSPERDAGSADAAAPDAAVPIGPECDGPDGSSCRPPRAFGVCVEGRCQRIACVSGFTDCDNDTLNGCEARVDEVDVCGACGVSCDEGEACQFGPLGFTCAAEVVCLLPEFDTDLDLTNGCEWTSTWGEGFAAPESGLVVDAIEVTPTGTVAVGEAQGEQRFALLPDWVETSVGGSVSGPVSSVTWDAEDAELLAAWPQAVVRWDGSEVAPSHDSLRCDNPLEIRDVTPHPVRALVAFESGVVSWENRDLCRDCGVSGRLFEREDYLRAFWPGTGSGSFEDAEVASCAPCSFDAATLVDTNPTACAPAACRPQGTPPGCDACDPTGCPDFDVQRVFSNGVDERAYILTSRGLVVLRLRGGWFPEWRLERPFDPQSSPGFAYVDATVELRDGDDLVTLLGNDGRVSSIVFPRTEGEVPRPLPTVGVGQAQVMTSFEEVLALEGPASLTFVGGRGRSAVVRSIGTDDGPSLAGLQHVATADSESGFVSLYEAPGVYFLRTFSR